MQIGIYKKNAPNGTSTELGDAIDYVRANLSDGYTEELLAKLNVSNDGKITIGA